MISALRNNWKDTHQNMGWIVLVGNAWAHECFKSGIFFFFFFLDFGDWTMRNLNMRIIYVSDTPYTYSLKVILCTIFRTHAFSLWPSHMRSRVAQCWCSAASVFSPGDTQPAVTTSESSIRDDLKSILTYLHFIIFDMNCIQNNTLVHLKQKTKRQILTCWISHFCLRI